MTIDKALVKCSRFVDLESIFSIKHSKVILVQVGQDTFKGKLTVMEK